MPGLRFVGESKSRKFPVFSLNEKEIVQSSATNYLEACDRQAHEDAQQRLARARAELDDPSFQVARVLEMFSQPLSNLWRHEAVLDRSLLRTLHELERLQAKRAGEHVPAPGVVDVNFHLPEDPRPDIGETALNGETDDGKLPIGGRQSG